ncbi:hypothetical protein Bbelb_425240 [Branchiostoma belcheri]|nr:hypothetical protein Bbelb_425240 [Branchiostoma belcheri]
MGRTASITHVWSTTDQPTMIFFGLLIDYLHSMVEGQQPLRTTKRVFVCKSCGPEPKTIVCDGTAIGFRKDFLQYQSAPEATEDQPKMPVVTGSKHCQRVFIRCIKSRALLLRYSGNKRRGTGKGKLGISEEEMTDLQDKLNRTGRGDVTALLKRLIQEGHITCAPKEYSTFLSEIARSTSLCGMLQIAGDVYAIGIMQKVAEGVIDLTDSQFGSYRTYLKTKAPVLTDFLSSVTKAGCVPPDISTLVSPSGKFSFRLSQKPSPDCYPHRAYLPRSSTQSRKFNETPRNIKLHIHRYDFGQQRARVHSTDLLCRIHLAREDSGQNEAERLNASMEYKAMLADMVHAVNRLDREELEWMTLEEELLMERTEVDFRHIHTNVDATIDGLKKLEETPGPNFRGLDAFLEKNATVANIQYTAADMDLEAVSKFREEDAVKEGPELVNDAMEAATKHPPPFVLKVGSMVTPGNKPSRCYPADVGDV